MSKKQFSLTSIEKLKDFDRYEGSRRHEIKVFDRTINYRGFEIKRNSYIPNGADGRWEVPELHYIAPGGVKKGFLTVSIIQSKEAIDKYYEFNIKLETV
ncbi:MAG: hypothetical protein ACOC3V_00775 [bacterium]